MSFDRRQFIQKALGTTATLSILPFFQSGVGQALLRESSKMIDPGVADDSFWALIQQAYTVSPTILNLNNGGVSPQPRVVQEAVEHYNKLSNEAPSYYMWRILDKGRESIREKLANLLGAKPEEVAINRNATEALETIVFGLRLKAGDEVVLSKYDYPNMINAWKQRAHRDGIILKWVDLNLPEEKEEDLVKKYEAAFTNRTKIVHLTHMINWTGQLIPVGAIGRKAKNLGIEVLVDGAHTFAQIPYAIEDLHCDYFGTSLHKWLCAPFGSGMLWVRSEKIGNLYPLFGSPDPESTDIKKFEHLGTRSFAIEQAIGQAIEFHHLIGSERKANRLRSLNDYWLDQVKPWGRIQHNHPANPNLRGAIANISVLGQDNAAITRELFNEFRIHTVHIGWEQVDGIRITPNVYTSLRDLDRLVEALDHLINKK